ncbi:MAG: hypothetical protein K8R08_01705 [Methanosarcinales archaeon]|nr:hypothetical protein [Methanosarcinales archaeon]
MIDNVQEMIRALEAAEYIREHVTRPVMGYVVGISAPPGKTMGHAGAIISGAAVLQRRRSRRWRVWELRWLIK